MRKLKLFTALFALAALTGTAALAAGETQHYVNARFGFSADLPARMEALPEPANGDGRSFEDAKSGLSISVYASYNVLMEDALQTANGHVPEGVKAASLSKAGDRAKDAALRWEAEGSVFWLRVRLVHEADGDDGTLISIFARCPRKSEKKCRAEVLAALDSLKATAKPAAD